MQQPHVSVILPTYNRCKLLPRAVRSVLSQTFQELELIVIDDGSDEDVPSALSQFSDPRLRYFRLDKNAGPAVARNLGIREAKGNWIAFQDSDDEWLITKLQQQMAVAAIPDPPALICGSYLIVREKQRARLIRPTDKMLAGDWDAQTLYDFPFIAPTWLVRRDAIQSLGGFNECLPNLEDWELVFRIGSEGYIRVLNAPLLVKHVEKDSLNLDMGKRLASLEYILNHHRMLWGKSPLVHARFLAEIGRLQSLQGATRRGRASLLRSLQLQLEWRTILHYAAASFGPTGLKLARRLLARMRTS